MIFSKSILTIWILAVAFAAQSAVAAAAEPVTPPTNYVLDPVKEAKITQMKALAPEAAFNRLKGPEFVANDKFMNKSIVSAFGNRREQALEICAKQLEHPDVFVEGETVTPNDGFRVAKRVMRMFPEEAVVRLLDLYDSGSPVRKANILSVLGKMQGGPEIRGLLIRALDDKTAYEEPNPEMVGYPLRICDMAYNQLVLRYLVPDVLRTIGNSHRIEMRDHHIGILRGHLPN
ncbi:MAG: hypothetical protein AB1640_18335 [bacterium]